MGTFVKSGLKGYEKLIQYSSITNLPTGVEKDNLSMDPDYVPPVIDSVTCVIGESVIDENFENFKIFSNFKYLTELRVILEDVDEIVIFDKIYKKTTMGSDLYINDSFVIDKNKEPYKISYLIKSEDTTKMFDLIILYSSGNEWEVDGTEQLTLFEVPVNLNDSIYFKLTNKI